MKGWVYVISNRAMSGLVKVGYSAKDPDLRAEELNHTNSPHPFVVEYDMLIEEPYQIEQRAHKYLSSVREGKEWFRCNAEEAIAAIQRAASGAAIVENFKRAHREKAEGIRRQHEAEEQRQRTLTERLRAIEAKAQEQETAIYEKYEQYLMGKYPKDPFWQYWLGCTFAVSILIIMLVSEKSDNWIFLMSIFGGAIAAVFVKAHVEAKERKSLEYRSILEKRDAKIEAARQLQTKLTESVHKQNSEEETFDDKAQEGYQCLK